MARRKGGVAGVMQWKNLLGGCVPRLETRCACGDVVSTWGRVMAKRGLVAIIATILYTPGLGLTLRLPLVVSGRRNARTIAISSIG